MGRPSKYRPTFRNMTPWGTKTIEITEVTTVLELPIWDCQAKKWRDAMPATIQECESLSKALNNIYNLCDVLAVGESSDEEFDESGEEPGGKPPVYQDNLIEIVKADRDYGQLLGDNKPHPYLAKQIQQRLRRRWLRLAINTSDTISQIVDTVNSFFERYSMDAGHVADFRDLFPNEQTLIPCPYTAEMLAIAREKNQWYGRSMAEAIALEDDADRRTRMKSIIAVTQQFRSELDAACKMAATDPEHAPPLGQKVFVRGQYLPSVVQAASIFDWCCAFWDVCHSSRASSQTTGGLVFTLFPDEIIKRLSDKQPHLQTATLISCHLFELANIIWGDQDTLPDPDPLIGLTGRAQYDPTRPFNKYCPSTAPNGARIPNSGQCRFEPYEFRGDPGHWVAEVRSSSDRPWKQLGMLSAARKQRIPPTSQVMDAVWYTDMTFGLEERLQTFGKNGSKKIILFWNLIF